VVGVSVRETGAGLLRALLQELLDHVPGAVGAVVAAADEPPRPGIEGRGEPPGPRRIAELGEVPDGDTAVREAFSTGRPVVAEAEPDAGGVARAVVAVPGEGGEGNGLVVALWLTRPAGLGDTQALEHVQPVLLSAVAVVEYCAGEEERAAQMVQMVQYRRVIEQAKGIVMAATGADADAAFATLARGSQHFNVRLRNLAVALVELVGGAPAEGPDDPGAVVTPSPQERHAAEQVWAALSSGPHGAAGGDA
jgi:hypothetical protein